MVVRVFIVRVSIVSSLAVALAVMQGCARHAQEAHEHHHGDHGHPSFDDAERWARVFDDPARDAWQKPDAVIERVGPAPDLVVADIGAGTGYFAVRLARAVPAGRVYGVDIEPDMVRYLDERARREGLDNLEGVLGAGGDPRLPEAVDLVWMVNTYHHLSDRTAYFERLRARLEPEGRVVIVDFKPGPRPVGPPESMKVPPEAIVSEMQEAGYRVVLDDRTLLPHQNVQVFEVVHR